MVVITITDDFDLQKITDSGQAFRIFSFGDGTYRFITGQNILYIRPGGKDSYDISCDEDVWKDVWFPYFHLNRSYQDVRKQIGVRDKYLQAAADHGMGIRILKQDPWEMIITFIISQQKTIPSIKKCVEELSVRYGTAIKTEREVIYAFPTPLQLSKATEEELRECKLGYRVPYIMDAAAQISGGVINLEELEGYSDKKIFEALKQIKGVGDKVSNCICLFAYGRTRLAPIDTWIKKVIDKEYKGKNPFTRYKDAAGIMQQYIFYYALSHKQDFQ